MMWPPSKATLNATPTERLVELSNAKKNFQLGTDRVSCSANKSCGCQKSRTVTMSLNVLVVVVVVE